MVELFLSIGVKTGEIVTVCSVNVPETVYVFYGLNKIGAISNMVDPRTSQEGLIKYVEEVKSDVIVTIDMAYAKFERALSKLKKVIIISPADSLVGWKRFCYQLMNREKSIRNNKMLYINEALKTYRGNCDIVPYYRANRGRGFHGCFAGKVCERVFEKPQLCLWNNEGIWHDGSHGRSDGNR